MNIRNFVIIAHIDHGKSTLADRFLELTGTVPERRMHSQYLDQLDLEQERGITIKMAPVRMRYTFENADYLLHLIDTPGHSDFSYEVSRALEAVEGAILLVDVTQGIQAQTLANFRAARKSGLTIIGAINKVDLRPPYLEKVVREVADLIQCETNEVFRISAKTGEGVRELLHGVIRRVPQPKTPRSPSPLPRALIFDSSYDDHKGVVASVRVFDGIFSGDEIELVATLTRSRVKEIGSFFPEQRPLLRLESGEIGYIATGIKDPGPIRIGDTVLEIKAPQSRVKDLALPGYHEPKPVVFVSLYPEETDDYEQLTRALQKLKLNDAALSIEPDQNEVLGRGFKVGFLGRLHFEIAGERLRREFGVPTVNTFPSVQYRVKTKNDWVTIIKPEDLPSPYDEIWEPMVTMEILIPAASLNNFFAIQNRFRLRDILTSTFSEFDTGQDRVKVTARMPLVELVSDFDDQLKSSTEGYASFTYELDTYEKADIVRVDVLVSHEVIPGLSRFFPRLTAEREARRMVERLKDLLPRQQFAQPIQAQAENNIIAREDIPALRKDVTGYLYGGDRTRKMKLWKKQQRGKKLLKERSSDVKISPHVFKELLKK